MKIDPYYIRNEIVAH